LYFHFASFLQFPYDFWNFQEKIEGVRPQKNSIVFGMWHLETNTQLWWPQAIWNSHFSKKSIHSNVHCCSKFLMRYKNTLSKTADCVRKSFLTIIYSYFQFINLELIIISKSVIQSFFINFFFFFEFNFVNN
jgi:hypothetical protein